jgi:D-arabinose 1-dehydrogenase-like Zn-dependent alcohol dehydrogenase
VPQAFNDALRIVSVGGRVVEIGNISPSLTIAIAPSTITFKSIELFGVVMYPPHYLKKSLDFLSAHMDHYPYREMCDATFPLAQAAEALDRSDRREVTRAALLPQEP